MPLCWGGMRTRTQDHDKTGSADGMPSSHLTYVNSRCAKLINHSPPALGWGLHRTSVTRRKHHRPGIAPNTNTERV